MSFNENTINYMRINNNLETLSNNQNLLFNILLSIKNSIANIHRYRDRERYNNISSTYNTTSSPLFSDSYNSTTSRNNSNRTHTPSSSSRTTSVPPSENVFNRLRNVEISLTEPFNTGILGFLNNIEPSSNNNITIENLLQNTEIVLYNSSMNINNTCSICRTDYEENSILRKINHCNHYFHQSCIDNWFKNNSTCPVCRHSLRDTNENNE